MDGKVTLFVWPDGTWCHRDEAHAYGWMSDDYEILYVPEEFSDDDIDSYVAVHLNS